jgi:regulator of protease activity HflC (stomatin/prohibitin superfamily)
MRHFIQKNSNAFFARNFFTIINQKITVSPYTGHFYNTLDENYVIYRANGHRSFVKLNSGINFYIPYIHTLYIFDTRMQIININISCTTKDYYNVNLSGNLYFNFNHEHIAKNNKCQNKFNSIEDYIVYTNEIGVTALISTIRQKNRQDIIKTRYITNLEICCVINEVTSKYGINCTHFALNIDSII